MDDRITVLEAAAQDTRIRLEDTRVRLEDTRDRLSRVETKLDAVATKSELYEVKADLIKWMVGSAVGLGATAITVMTFVLNYATPKMAPVQQAPIIINVPAPAPAPSFPAAR